MFDAHTHVHFPAFDADRPEVMKRAQKEGVKMITVGTQLSTSRGAVEFAKKYPGEVWATVGFHPGHVGSVETWHHDTKEQKDSVKESFDVDAFAELAEDERVVAIGECGLDYYRFDGLTDRQVMLLKEEQKNVFIAQAQIALSVGKALMIHCRPSKGTDDAYEDLFAILSAPIYAPLKKVLHFYVGSVAMTKKFVDAGYYFTLGGVITFSRDYDGTIATIPMDRILMETDAPYVAPMPYRGKRNEPVYVIESAKKMAELKGVPYDKLEKQTTENVKTVFGI